MGVFHDMIEAVNRTSEELQIQYDGQRHRLAPNYTADGTPIPDVHNMIPRVVIPYALNQTVVMGTEDWRNPGNFRSKIGIKDPKDKKQKSWHDCSFIGEKTTEVTRVSQAQIMEEAVNDPTATIVVKGKLNQSHADASMGQAPAPFDLRTQ